jgi:hypothetical protein
MMIKVEGGATGEPCSLACWTFVRHPERTEGGISMQLDLEFESPCCVYGTVDQAHETPVLAPVDNNSKKNRN